MAKKKEGNKEVLDLLEKSVFDSSAIMEKDREVIHWSPVLDEITGGGILSGSFVLISGNYKSGKTSACLHFAKKAQKKGYKIVFCNVEHRLSMRDLKSADGLDLSPDKFELITSSEGNIIDGENFCAMAHHKLKYEQKIVMIMDSLSQLCPKELIDNGVQDRLRDPTPLLMSRFCKLIAAPIKLNDNIFMGITHEIINQAPAAHGGKMQTGGRKIQYAAEYSLQAKYSSAWTEGPESNKVIVGQDINWVCLYSAIGHPWATGVGKLRYNYGLDDVAEMLLIGQSIMNIKNGSWYTFYGEKFQGETAAIEYLRENPDVLAKLQDDLAIRLGYNAS